MKKSVIQAVLLCAVIGGCGEAITEVERVPADYVLVAVNQLPLPAKVADEAGSVEGVECLIDSGAIELTPSGVWFLESRAHCTVNGEAPEYCTTHMRQTGEFVAERGTFVFTGGELERATAARMLDGGAFELVVREEMLPTMLFRFEPRTDG